MNLGMRLPTSIVALGLLGFWALLPCACVDLSRPPQLSGTRPPGHDGATSDAAHDTAPDGTPLVPDTGTSIDDHGDLAGVDVPATAPDGSIPDGGPDDVPVTTLPDAGPDVPVTSPPDAAPDIPIPPTPAANGTPCGAAAGCQSGACVDGVCCENSCNSACHSCNLAGQPGKCLPTPAGADPDNDCTASAPSTCGLDGACNGLGACRRFAAGTTCQPGSCSGSTAVGAAICDGAGTCGTASIHECAPYLCGAGVCRNSCAATTDCKAGYVCTTMACVPPSTDGGAPDAPSGAVLLIDDFSDATLMRNTMGGAVTWDNQNVTLTSGAVRFSWNGQQEYSDFIETFLQSFCAYDIRAYRTLRFRMSATAGPRTMRIFLPFSNNNCSTAATPLGGSVTVTTTMTTFDVDISGSVRDKALFVEFSPVVQDGTSYLLDDVQLIQ
jgi:hypothetical protein